MTDPVVVIDPAAPPAAPSDSSRKVPSTVMPPSMVLAPPRTSVLPLPTSMLPPMVMSPDRSCEPPVVASPPVPLIAPACSEVSVPPASVSVVPAPFTLIVPVPAPLKVLLVRVAMVSSPLMLVVPSAIRFTSASVSTPPSMVNVPPETAPTAPASSVLPVASTVSPSNTPKVPSKPEPSPVKVSTPVPPLPKLPVAPPTRSPAKVLSVPPIVVKFVEPTSSVPPASADNRPTVSSFEVEVSVPPAPMFTSVASPMASPPEMSSVPVVMSMLFEVIDPETVVVPVSTVTGPVPCRVPEMMPPASVAEAVASTVPAMSPPVWPKVAVVSVPDPSMVPPPWVTLPTVSSLSTVSVPVPETVTLSASARSVPTSSCTVPPDTTVVPSTAPATVVLPPLLDSDPVLLPASSTTVPPLVCTERVTTPPASLVKVPKLDVTASMVPWLVASPPPPRSAPVTDPPALMLIVPVPDTFSPVVVVRSPSMVSVPSLTEPPLTVAASPAPSVGWLAMVPSSSTKSSAAAGVASPAQLVPVRKSPSVSPSQATCAMACPPSVKVRPVARMNTSSVALPRRQWRPRLRWRMPIWRRVGRMTGADAFDMCVISCKRPSIARCPARKSLVTYRKRPEKRQHKSGVEG